MSGTYVPASHTSPITATVAEGGNTQNINGMAPGPVFTQLVSPRAPSYVFLPTGTTADGFPDTMYPFQTVPGAGTGSVSVT